MDDKLEIKIKSKLDEAINEFNRLTSSAKNFNNVITTTIAKLDSNKKPTGFTQTVKSLQDGTVMTLKYNKEQEILGATIKTNEKAGKTLGNTLKDAFSVNKLYLYWNLTKRIRTGLAKMVTSAIDYLEAQNKFEASMGKDAAPYATKFVNQMTEAVGIAKTELMDYMSTYKNILSGLGNFTDIQSEEISESLTKMALDYSSLFNVSTSDAMNKFQSALTGSIRPIRSDSGFDVSDTTIGAKAQELGVERSVGQLNQMEKRLLRIIVLMDQMRRTGAMGDLALQIDQPAYQLKVLKTQLQEVGMWLGAVFTNTLGKILPYINAFVMTIKELIKMFAIFVGFGSDRVPGFKDVLEVTDGVSSGLGSANKKAKELKKTLMGFDVLNVITTPKETEPSGGGGGVGLIDSKISDALEDYDSLMENIEMTATKIRDRIMDWLGFTKIIDPLTKEVSWELRNGYTNLEKIRDVVLGIGLAIAGWKIAKFLKLTDLKTGAEVLSKMKEHMTTLGKMAGAVTLSIGIVTTFNGLMSRDAVEMAVGSLETGLGVFLLALQKYGWKLAGTAGVAVAFFTMTLSLTLSNRKYSLENFERTAENLYGDYKDLNIWQKFNTFMTGLGEGLMLTFAEALGYKGEDFFHDFGKAWNDYFDNVEEGYFNWKADMIVLMDEFETAWEDYFDRVEQGYENWKEDLEQGLDDFGEAWEDYFDRVELGYEQWKRDIKNKASELFGNLTQKWTDFKNNTKNTLDRIWREDVKPWFTWQKWKSLADEALRALTNAFQNFRLPDIKLPHFEVEYDTQGKIAEAFKKMGLNGLPKLKVNWYADGGLPNVGEMFVAREAGPELVGKIGNSNAVMNNQQIVSAVSQGVASAVSSVLGNNNGNRPIQLILNGREIAYATRDGEQRLQNIFGTA